MCDLSLLPGGDLIQKGLEDLKGGLHTAERLLVEIASPQLKEANLLENQSTNINAELDLYALLCETEDNPYSTYNSLQRRICSFEQCLMQSLNN